MKKTSPLKFIFIVLITLFFLLSTSGSSISHRNNKLLTQSEITDGLMNSSWPMFGHDAKHTGQSSYAPSGNIPIVKWKFRMDGMTVSSPAIDDEGMIYIGANELHKSFYAINPNGTEKWRFDSNSWVESSPCIGNNGVVYFGSNDGGLYAFYPNGTQKWRTGLGGGWVFSSPVIDDNGVIFAAGASSNKISAICPNGSIIWQYPTNDWIYSSAAIDDNGIIYIGSHDENLYALYPNGTLKWKYKTNGEVKSPPAIGEDGTIYFCSWDDYLYALYPNGSLKWRFDAEDAPETSPSFDNDGNIIIGSYNGKIFSVSPEGNKNWEYQTGDWVLSSATIDDNGMIYIGSFDGFLYALRPDGTLIWRFDAGEGIESTPIIGENGTIYVAAKFHPPNSYTYLYAIEVITDYPPSIPNVDGPLEGKINEPHIYTAVSTDDDGHNISYLFDWGDESDSGWLGPYPSEVPCEASHTWTKRGNYIISVKARDELGMESEGWGTLEVKMPHGRFNFLHYLTQLIYRRFEADKVFQYNDDKFSHDMRIKDGNNARYHARIDEYDHSRNIDTLL